jgi:hypothetical protein
MAVEMAIEMRFKLRMLGVNLVGPTTMLCDNMSVVLNCSLPTSGLKKKHNAIAYHKVRQAIAAGIVEIVHVPSTENLADILTKALGAQKLSPLTGPVFFRPVPDQGEYKKINGDPVIPTNPGLEIPQIGVDVTGSGVGEKTVGHVFRGGEPQMG